MSCIAQLTLVFLNWNNNKKKVREGHSLISEWTGSLKVDFTLILNLFYLKVTIMNTFNLLNVVYFYEKAYARDTVTQMTDFIVLSSVK